MPRTAAPTAYRLRDFHKEDFLALWQIDQECFRPGIAYTQEELAYYMTRRSAFTIVIEKTDPVEPMGFLVAHRARRRDGGRVGHIVTIDVLASARRGGVGTQLLLAAEQRLQQSGCESVVLETAVDNAAAIAFYQRHGYSIVRTLPGYYSDGVDALRMEKPLAFTSC